MVECKQILDLLSELIDEELETAVEPVIRHHIFNCQHCSSNLNTFRSSLQIFHSMSMINVPVRIHRQLWKVIHIEVRHKTQKQRHKKNKKY